MKEKVQKFGRTLSAMVMPNIAVFIAWGLIASFFIADGWFPNKTLAALVEPMNKFLLPILIAYTGGHNVYGQRGGIVGAIMAIGVLVGAPIPMFIGAMIAGPLGAYLMKKVDGVLKDHTPQGFEMLVNNFSAGILGFILAIIGCLAINPACIALNDVLYSGVHFFVKHGLLPLLSIIVEPAKVLFLNNAINHGIFSPIGIQEAAATGKSIFYLIESNPGPGLGILLAYCFFGKGSSKASAPGAAIIHFFGGIHEIYFPYILMNPLLLIAAIAGGATGILINTIFNSGLVSAASPGSIIAILGMCSSDSYLGVIISVVAATAVSFFVGSFILKISKSEDEDLEEAKERMESMKNKPEEKVAYNQLRKIVFACDAGMGSSAMGATILTKKLKAAGIDVDVPHYAINDIPQDTEVVVTHQSLVERVNNLLPNVVVFPITNFMGGSEYDEIVEKLK
ncbi:PTS mannitol transporter subunit IICB [Erysipelatoclostridium sp. AM42-17]|uniref:PTS mannitol transporter subunit IICB n=1 Tax=Erysipelatoclostridium sp. AM42-17 TaxID=2293102 RepID=UPI000E53CC94|nr:PTS mannitol transporter subunit IICBA [Erysipelatoclostridium sp. AM42-17]RHS95855.1 PTS mannitol transporter subunit IICBA [Erysipelatoclostridium sp. AM42-17]